MPSIPGPRTNPTVKSNVIRNRKGLRTLELRLGVAQIVIVIGAVCGCLVCAFYLGYFTGQKIGFESALAGNATSFARFPIEENRIAKEDSDEIMSDVYARLKEIEPKHIEKKEVPEPAVKEQHNQEMDSSKILAGLLDANNMREKSPHKTDEGEGVQHARLDKPTSTNNTLGFGEGVPHEEAEQPVAGKTLGAILPKMEKSEPLHSGSINQTSGKEAKNRVVSSEKHEAKEETSKVVRVLAPAAEPKVNDKSSTLLADTVPSIKTPPKKAVSAERALEPQPQKIKIPTTTRVKEQTKVKVPPTEPDSSVEIQLQPGWYAQVSAPKSIKDARALAGKLSASGFSVSIERANVRGQEYFRVLAGPETSRNYADRLVEQIKRERYIRSKPFIRKIR